jgi:hypothetical protein
VPKRGERALEETNSPTAESADVLEAIRDLSARVGGLQAELSALRAETRPLPAEASEAPGWSADGQRDTLAWVRGLESPARRRPDVPWLLLEITFLAAVAVGAAVADVEWPFVVAVMAGAWALVALGEVASSRAARRRQEAAYAPLAIYGAGAAPDPSWFAPPVERTPLDDGEDTGARLPPPA